MLQRLFRLLIFIWNNLSKTKPNNYYYFFLFSFSVQDSESVEVANKAGVKLSGIKGIGGNNLYTFGVIPSNTSKAPLLTRLIDDPKY